MNLLCRGAYAKVIKGKELKTGKVVAVKMYKRYKFKHLDKKWIKIKKYH